MARVTEPTTGPMFKRGKVAAQTKASTAVKDKGFLAFLHKLPCVVTGIPSVEAAHIRYAAPRYGKPETGMGRKSDDRWAVPLSANEHRESRYAQHNVGEKQYWRALRIDPCLVSTLLYAAYVNEPTEDDAVRVCRSILSSARYGQIQGEFA